MRRFHVFLLQSLIAVPGCLLLFAQCRIVPEDTVQPVPTLSRGDLLGDPVVESTPKSVSLIKVNNAYDDLLASSRYANIRRPTRLVDYGQFSVIESIRPDALMNHEFNWVGTQRKNVLVAIFKNVVRIESNQISNKSDLVWIWTPSDSKLDTDPGRITYAEGKAASLDSNNRFTYSPPVNLNSDTYYVWCVLAWDKQGTRIEYASRELPFRVENVRPMLFRGPLNVDPVVQSKPESVNLITVDNLYHKLIDTEYKQSLRPQSDVKEYNQFKFVEIITQKDLIAGHQFKWLSTQRQNVTVLILRNLLRVASTDISTNDVVWRWDYKGTADPGKVIYADVKPTPSLTPNTYYVWCVLVRDNQNRIIGASREMPFQVK